MKKKALILIIWIVTVGLAFYAGLQYKPLLEENLPEQETETMSGFSEITEIPVSDIEKIAKEQKGITEEEAEELCGDVLGNEAEENGFPISYQCTGGVSRGDKLYYVMHITWLVENHHWSYIGNCYVSSDGTEIYDGIVSPEEYQMTDLLWQK